MELVFLWIKRKQPKQNKFELHVKNCTGNLRLKWKCVISFQTSLFDMHSPIFHCLAVTDTPDLCVCSCVSLKTVIPFWIWVLKFLLVFVAKLENWRWGGRMGGSGSGVYPGNWLSPLHPGNVHISMLSSKPIVLRRTFLCSLVSHVRATCWVWQEKEMVGMFFSFNVKARCRCVLFICWMLHNWQSGTRKISFKVEALAG